MFFTHSSEHSPRRTHWVYDDPSGVPEGPLTVSLPEPLRGPVELAAADAGLSPAEWLAGLVRSSLRPTTIRAI
jgi:hypothetical protein